jgi:hypothetical protein
VEIKDWFGKMTGTASLAKVKGVQSLIILVCLSIWQEQNTRIFNAKEKQPSRIVTEIRDEAKLRVQAGAKDLSWLVSPIASE